MLKEVLVIDKSYSINLEGQAKNLKIVVMRLDFAYRNSQRRKKELRSFDDFLLRSSSSCCCCSLEEEFAKKQKNWRSSSSSGQCCKNLMGQGTLARASSANVVCKAARFSDGPYDQLFYYERRCWETHCKKIKKNSLVFVEKLQLFKTEFLQHCKKF